MYETLETDLLKDIEYNTQDLVNLATTKADQNIETKEWEIFGLYTGCLLDMLTLRNRAKEKETVLYFNGMGSSFKYLFSYATHVDTLILDNLDGEHNGCYLGAFGGDAKKVIIRNCSGKLHACNIGSNKGKVDYLIAVDNSCELSFIDTATCIGKAGLVLLVNNEATRVGDRIADERGKADLVVAVDNKDKEVLSQIAGNEGYVGFVVAVDNHPEDICDLMVRDSGYISLVNIVSVDQSDFKFPFPREHEGYVKKLLITGAPDIPEYESNKEKSETINALNGISWLFRLHRKQCYGKIIEEKRSPKKYKKTVEKLRLNDMAQLAKSISGKSNEEIFDIAENIYDIYKKVKPLRQKIREFRRSMTNPLKWFLKNLDDRAYDLFEAIFHKK